MEKMVQAVKNISTKRETLISLNASISVDESKTELALDLLNQMRHQLHISPNSYFFAVKLFRDSFNVDFFIKCEEDLRMTYIERKYVKSVLGTRNMGGL